MTGPAACSMALIQPLLQSSQTSRVCTVSRGAFLCDFRLDTGRTLVEKERALRWLGTPGRP